MSDHSKIEWTDATWNPVRGCTKISPGCDHCYAETFAERFREVPGIPMSRASTFASSRRSSPNHCAGRRRRMVFVNSMSDLFHKDVPEEYVEAVADVWNGPTGTPTRSDQAVVPDAEHAPEAASGSPRTCRTSGGA